jgi:hypothetical protein
VQTGLSTPVQGGSPLKGGSSPCGGGLMILVMPELGLHIELDQLELEAKQHHNSCPWQHQSYLFSVSSLIDLEQISIE